MNKVILIGHVGADPVLKDANGTSVVSVSLATKESYKDKEGNWKNITDWHTIEIWGKSAEAFAKVVGKGDLIAIEGANKTKVSDGKEGAKHYNTRVVVSSFQVHAKKGKASEIPEDAPQEQE